MSYETATNLDTVPASAAPTSPFGRVVDGLNAAGSAVIGLVMLLMCADVLLRNLANRPIDGVAELVATSIIVIVFLQLPATLRHGRMSSADLFIEPFIARRPRAGKRLRAVFSLAGVFACSVIAYATWPMLDQAWKGDEFLGIEGIFTFPIWPMRVVVILGATLATVQYALLAAQDWSEAKRVAPSAEALHV